MTTCKEVVDFLLKYLENELPQSQRAEFERHLQGCSCCRNYLDTYRETIRLSKCCMCDGPDAPKIPDDLVAAILKAKSNK